MFSFPIFHIGFYHSPGANEIAACDWIIILFISDWINMRSQSYGGKIRRYISSEKLIDFALLPFASSETSGACQLFHLPVVDLPTTEEGMGG